MRKLKKPLDSLFVITEFIVLICILISCILSIFPEYKQNPDLIKNGLISIIFIEVILLRFRLEDNSENKTEK